jgi:hypothetical protein
MQKKHLVTAAVIGLILLVGLIGGFLLKRGSAVSNSPQAESTVTPPSAAGADSSQTPQSQTTAETISVGMANTAEAPKEVVKLTPNAKQIPWAPEVKAQLKAFQTLQVKSVLTPAEEAARRKLLQDGDLIAQLGAVLRSRVGQKDPDFTENQNLAIDFLVEALKYGNEQAAVDAIWEQIRDGQIEDTSIPLKERQVLAGIKGEILYHATALKPETFEDVEMDLPGPVSQKIWKNVQEQHQANLEGSLSEADEHLNQSQGK